MRFVDTAPRGYSSHNTGDEHTLKHYGDPIDIDAIRRAVNPTVKPWNVNEIREIMWHNLSSGNLLNVFEDSGDVLEMVGGMLVRYEYLYKGRVKRITLDASDVAVAPEHQHKGLGHYLLSKAITATPFTGRAMPFASELIVTDTFELLSSEAKQHLVEAGFSRCNENGDPKMLLAGWWQCPLRNIDYAEEYEKLMHNMPSDWSGFLTTGCDFGGRPRGYHVFRNGVYVGCASFIKGSQHNDEHSRTFGRYNYYDSTNQVIVTNVIQPSDQPFFAASDLVNRFASE